MGQDVIAVKPRILAKGARVFGPGKADLLERIERTGSISAAARELEMSYSRAWGLVEAMNAAFKQPLVAAAIGGKRGGGASVTEAGRQVLALYRKVEASIEAEADSHAPSFRALLK